jgi:hypothetical protein
MPRRRRHALIAALPLLLAACASGEAPSTTAPGTPEPTASASAPVTPAPIPPSAVPVPPSPTAAPEPGSGAWTQLETRETPAAREDHTWTLDPDTNTAWLFGGRDGGRAFDDLWRFDLDTDEWQRIAAADGPAARFGHTATWVTGFGLVVWSGQAGSTFFDDLWAFDPNTGAWRELPADGARPLSRYGSCAALGPDERLWVSHGFTSDGVRFADTWAYDFRAGRWADETPDGDAPVARCLHDCLWTPDGRLVLYAGQTTGVPAIGDLWTRGVDEAWTRGERPIPAARQLYGLATLGEAAWIFGGGAEDRSKLGDLWRLDLADLTWREVTPGGEGPAARSGATLIADPRTGRLLLFGGLTEDAASDETWAIQLAGP